MTKDGIVKRGRDAALFRRRDPERLELLMPPTLVVCFPTSATTEDNNSASPTIGEEEVILYSVAKGFSRIVLDEDEEGQEQQQSSSQVQGDIIVTTKRLLFASRINEEKMTVPPETANENAVWSSHDFVVDIQGIILHALATDPEPSLYCQFEEEQQQPVTQVYFFPPTSTCSPDPSLLLSKLFHALAMAIERNPVTMDDDDEDGLLVGEESDNSDNGIPIFHPTQQSDGAPPEQRRAMLERLDALLVVPPDLEIHSDNDDFNGEVGRVGRTITTRKRTNDGAEIVQGQFDDAEEDEEDFNML